MGGKRKAVCLFLFVLFLHAVVLSGYSPPKMLASSGPGDKASLITFDVCGHHAPANSAGHMDLTAALHEASPIVYHYMSVFPPTPDTAAPSAEPGDLEHPPEA